MVEARSLCRRLLAEPLVQFTLPAALLFGLSAWAGGGAEPIHVTAEAVDALTASRATVLARPLNDAERRELVEEFIAEEVLVREAVARGLDRHDGKVREHLVNKITFLLDEEPPEPTDAQLSAFHRDHPELYTTRPSLSLEHVFFAEPPDDGVAILDALQAGAPVDEVSDPFYLGSHLGRITPNELEIVLGRDFAAAVAALADEAWHGPIRSTRGTHFVRLTGRHEARRFSADEVGFRLRDDWTRAWTDAARARRVAAMRTRYEIVVDGVEGQR